MERKKTVECQSSHTERYPLNLPEQLKMYGIRIIPFIAGDVFQVLDAYQKEVLFGPSFQMPGCGMRRRNRFRGGYG